MDDFKNELKKLKVDKFNSSEIKPWDNAHQNEAMMIRGRCGGCGGCGRCGGGCHRCGRGCSCSCSCSCVCSCFFPCFFRCFF